MQTHLETLRREAADCRRISDYATDEEKRELFSRLADHLNVLAGEVARAIDTSKGRRRS
jgi:hypothetical protein